MRRTDIEEVEQLTEVYGIDIEKTLIKELSDSINESILNNLGVQSPRQIEAEKKRLAKIREDRNKKIDGLINGQNDRF